MKYLCSISFGLHDIDADAHDFYKWAKKEKENSAIKVLFFSVDNYERLLSFLSEACSGIKSVDGLMKLHAAFHIRQTNCGSETLLVFVKIVLEHLSSLEQHASTKRGMKFGLTL